MKITDLFCSSPASTAVRSTINHTGTGESTKSRRSSELHNRRSRNTNDKDKIVKPNVPCMSSEMPLIPIPRISCRNSFDSASEFRKKITSAHLASDTRRKSSADVSEFRRLRSSMSSSRYLLKDHNSFTDDDKDVCLSSHSSKDLNSKPSSTSSFSSSSSSTSTSSPVPSTDQVVVLRVSIHCKGCEGKVRKHISKMEGVTSYKVDLATKKVTVVGKVTPLQVVQSISKVKSAQLWPASSPHFHVY